MRQVGDVLSLSERFRDTVPAGEAESKNNLASHRVLGQVTGCWVKLFRKATRACGKVFRSKCVEKNKRLGVAARNKLPWRHKTV